MGRRWLDMREDMGVRNDSHLFSGRHGVKAEAVGPRAFSECSKGCCIHLHAPPRSSHIALSIAWDVANNMQNGSHDCHGPAKTLGMKTKPANRVSIA
jgi:hypothetical protein